ncbi:Alpha-1,2-mannosidase [hydrothermal vent metagenome]|uniref:Alpha-1,2-mannosidase n=1 Tax=hydrothermal vent metagenome TaxID=652676 RepID=A0A3B1CVP8_9ZZZZ
MYFNKYFRKIIKFISYIIGISTIILISILFGAWLKYSSIVGSFPNNNTRQMKPGNYGKWVNVFIGTGGFPAWICGMNFPGTTVPFGMVRLSPETASLYTNTRGYNTSGYYYGDNKIIGFSHTRLAGTGATDGGSFLFTPSTKSADEINYHEDYYHIFSHSDEAAFPGYYSVKLKDEGIFVELTATERVGLHRYTFSENTNRSLMIKVTNALGEGRAEDGQVTIYPDKNEIAGSARLFGTFSKRYGGIKVYFVAYFDKPFSKYGIWDGSNYNENMKSASSNDITVNLSFDNNNQDQIVNVKVGISYVSIDNARLNLNSEVGKNSFDDILQNAIAKWEDKLSIIKINGSTGDEKVIFYSSLYRSFQMPTTFNDVNGEYLGFDNKTHRAVGFTYYTDLSLWDTFRTIHPLFTLIAKDHQRDMLGSLVQMAKQGGWLPRWPSGNGYTGSMLGTPADIIIAGSYLKGIKDFDVDLAFKKMKLTALAPTPKGAAFPGRRSIAGYLKYEYCPADIKERSVSRTLEYAWADHSISLLAGVLGKEKDSLLFAEHAKYYKNVWNPETQYFQARNSDGSFVKKFKPLQLTYTDWDEEYTEGYVEGSAMQWRWAVPFDANGLISLFKTKDYFISELNDFFALSEPQLATWIPDSYYWHGNEPDIHSAYLFNYVERPDLTQKWVKWILDNKYDNTYIGIDGNDDAGTLSAWYIFSSIGFYPIAGSDVYQLGAPLFKSAEIDLGGKILSVIAENYSPSNIYVEKVFLNDTLLDRSWIKHSEIANGGTLRFVMSKSPMVNDATNK